MAYEHKPDTGTIFINDKREKETHPHGKGSALIGGVEYWVSSWNVTTDRDGSPLPTDKYRKNLSFTRKDSQHAPNPASQQAPPPADDFQDQEIPF